MKVKENQEHTASSLVLCMGKENDWFHSLGGGETCPEAGRHWEGRGTEGVTWVQEPGHLTGPLNICCVPLPVAHPPDFVKTASLPGRGS